MSVPTHEVSFGFGSTPATAVGSITWYPFTTSAREANTDRGRSSELNEFQPGTADYTFDDPLRLLDPENDSPNYLNTTGATNSYATTPDAAAYDVSTDQWGRWYGRLTDWTPSTDSTLIGRYTAGGVDRLWRLRITTTGFPQLIWFESGGSAIVATSTAATGFTNNTDGGVGYTIDVDDAGSYRVKFWTSTDGTTWSQLGSDRTGTATNIRTGTAELGVNGVAGATEWTVGRCYFAGYGTGTTLGGGTVLANPDFRYAYGGPTSFTDGSSRVWTVQGTATIALVSYYPLVVPMVPVRYRATHNGTTRYISMAYATSFRHSFQPPEMATSTVSCVDRFDPLASADLPASVFELEVLADSPIAWYKLNEESGTTVADSSGNAYDATFEGDVYGLSAQPLMPYQVESVLALDGSRRAVLPTAARITSAPYSIEFVGKLGIFDLAEYSTALWRGIFDQGQDPGDGILIGFFYQELFGLVFFDTFQFLSNVSGTLRVTTSVDFTTVLNPWIPHHYVLVDDGSTLKVYVDGVNVTGSVSSSGVLTNGPNAYIGGTTVGELGGAEYLPFIGDLGPVIVYDSELSAGRVLAHYEALTAPWDGDTTGERLEALLDEIDHPSADRDIDTGISTLGPANLGIDALSGGKFVENTEAGKLYISADGKVVFRSRHDPVLNTTVVATLGENPDAGEILYEPDLQYRYDRDLIRNVVTGRRTGGKELMVKDDTSIAQYQRRKHDVGEVAVSTDNEVRARIEWTLDHNKNPVSRAEQVTIKPLSGSSNAVWAFVLDADIGQRVILKRHPQQVGDAIEQEMIIEGVTHSVIGQAWVTTLRLSPADIREYWLLGTSELGSGTRLAY